MKQYTVFYKRNVTMYYIVEAPSKRIAKWAALNLFNHEYCGQFSTQDLIVYRTKEDI